MYLTIFFILNVFVLKTAKSKLTTQQSTINSEFVCTTPHCLRAASVIRANLDPTINPCDDFYSFACGGFQARTTIPEDKSAVTSFNIISDRVERQLKKLLEVRVKQNDIRPFALLKQLYDVCMNTKAIEMQGLGAAKSLLHEAGGWPLLEGKFWNEKKFDWKNTMYKFRELGLPTYNFIFMYVGVDAKNSSRHMINFDQGLLSLDREYLIKGFNSELVKAYYEYLVDVAVIFGARRVHAMIDLKESLQFEIELANLTVPKEARRNLTHLCNPMTVGQLQERYKSIPWMEYIQSIIALEHKQITSDEVVDVAVPEYFSNLEKLLSKTDKRVQANYLMSFAVNSIISCLTKTLRTRELQYKQMIDGVRVMRPRWKECVNTATSGIHLAAGALYINKYFNKDDKKKAEALVSNVKATFTKMLTEVSWMDKSTRKNALKKVTAMVSHVGYPAELLNNENLEDYYVELEPSYSYLEFVLKIRRFMDNNSFNKLHTPVNKTEWTRHSYVTRVNAFYNNQENSIQLPAGILQGVFFNGNIPNYMNYGAIGYVIGHEITHGFDDIGKQYNKDGNLINWWAKDTKQAFLDKSRCIIQQYSNYCIPGLNLNLNGVNTQGENIADNGGIKEAYLAYNSWECRHGKEPALPGFDFTPQQMFWISAANLWCSVERKERMRQHVNTDPHSPAYFRVIGPFRNSKYFSRDFNCNPGSKMNPKTKCSVW